MAKLKYKGIYAYKDIKTDEIVYIGKDSLLYKKSRHIQHHSKQRYDAQKINRILQLNPGRYEYTEIIRLPQNTSRNELDDFERRYINLYAPKFNFTEGGDGGATNKGKTFTKEHRCKISEAHMGKKLSKETREKLSKNNARYMLGRHHSEETKRKISESEKDKEVSMETKIKRSKATNKLGYYRVYKQIDKRAKQGFTYVYKWRENGYQKKLSSVNLLALKTKVISKGLPWIKLDNIEE